MHETNIDPATRRIMFDALVALLREKPVVVTETKTREIDHATVRRFLRWLRKQECVPMETFVAVFNVLSEPAKYLTADAARELGVNHVGMKTTRALRRVLKNYIDTDAVEFVRLYEAINPLKREVDYYVRFEEYSDKSVPSVVIDKRASGRLVCRIHW